ncbi:hypothetical protein DFR48_1152 [Ciceribacter lividus]|uniref:Uncharacterized protein n=1 Tax=Ciceribacter lividus TaxID=1197950 RepID=A0A6I7HGR2_9HYPH|nr:hypothetical protein [Ciceribacter lividus]RCW20139.1 hypothetical protein DFR48_1152 [Ciceribacter lividus]
MEYLEIAAAAFVCLLALLTMVGGILLAISFATKPCPATRYSKGRERQKH